MATKKPGKTVKHVALAPDVADRLLDLLGTDNAFRRIFRKDPVTALVQAGYIPSAHGDGGEVELAHLRTSLTVERLAPKQRINQSRDQIRKMLTDGLAMIPIQLNVESTPSRRVRK